MRRKRILIGLFPVFVAMTINKNPKHPLEGRGAVLYKAFLAAGVGSSCGENAAGFDQCRSQWVNQWFMNSWFARDVTKILKSKPGGLQNFDLLLMKDYLKIYLFTIP